MLFCFVPPLCSLAFCLIGFCNLGVFRFFSKNPLDKINSLWYNLDMLAMTAVVAVPCRLCQEVTDLTVNAEGFVNWQAGEYIQDALPELSADMRELLISGTCPTCWEKMFPSDEEE